MKLTTQIWEGAGFNVTQGEKEIVYTYKFQSELVLTSKTHPNINTLQDLVAYVAAWISSKVVPATIEAHEEFFADDVKPKTACKCGGKCASKRSSVLPTVGEELEA